MQLNPRPRDYIATGEDLYFAVVLDTPENGRIISSLRYIKTQNGIRKISTFEAWELLKYHYPHYLYPSKRLSTEITAVPLSHISRLYKPEDATAALSAHCPDDALLRKARDIIKYFIDKGIGAKVLGITGSVMMGFHGPDSDLDFVIYDRDSFYAAQRIIRGAIDSHIFSELNHSAWLESYKRRSCTLPFDEYLFHEKRKNNKFIYHGTKVDINYQPLGREVFAPISPVTKTAVSTIRTKIIDDRFIFDYPARYIVNHSDIKEILVYTATYYGQAFKDESIEARGMVEYDANKKKHMVIGTSREAPGEFLRVIRN